MGPYSAKKYLVNTRPPAPASALPPSPAPPLPPKTIGAPRRRLDVPTQKSHYVAPSEFMANIRHPPTLPSTPSKRQESPLPQDASDVFNSSGNAAKLRRQREFREKPRLKVTSPSTSDVKKTTAMTDEEVDVAIIHASETVAVNYIRDIFLQMDPRRRNCQRIRVKVTCIETLKGDEDKARADFRTTEMAHVQLVVMSSNFIQCCRDKTVRSNLKKVFKPPKILCLLSGSVDETKLKSPLLKDLGSPNTWRSVKFETINLDSVSELLEEMVMVLDPSSCSSFGSSCASGSPAAHKRSCGQVLRNHETPAKFDVLPTTLSWEHSTLTLLLENKIKHNSDLKIKMESPQGLCIPINDFTLRNPYAVSFDVPKYLRQISDKLSIRVTLFDLDMGSREIEVKTKIDDLKNILDSVTYPLEVMTLTMCMSALGETLDEHLSTLLKHRRPSPTFGPDVSLKTGQEYPSWVHFSAAFGMDALTWALLDLPGGEVALTLSNCRGLLPSALALRNGFFSLAQELQKAEFLTRLSAKVASTETYDAEGNNQDTYIGRTVSPSSCPRHTQTQGSSPAKDTHKLTPQRPSSDIVYENSSELMFGKTPLLCVSSGTSSPSRSPDSSDNSSDIRFLLSAWKRTQDTGSFLKQYHSLIRRVRQTLQSEAIKWRVVSPECKSPDQGYLSDQRGGCTGLPLEGGSHQNLVEKFWKALEACRKQLKSPPRTEIKERLESCKEEGLNARNAPNPTSSKGNGSKEPKGTIAPISPSRSPGHSRDQECDSQRRSPVAPPRQDDDSYITTSDINCPSVFEIIVNRHDVAKQLGHRFMPSSSFCEPRLARIALSRSMDNLSNDSITGNKKRSNTTIKNCRS